MTEPRRRPASPYVPRRGPRSVDQRIDDAEYERDRPLDDWEEDRVQDRFERQGREADWGVA